jgi:hypothetical protein
MLGPISTVVKDLLDIAGFLSGTRPCLELEEAGAEIFTYEFE